MVQHLLQQHGTVAEAMLRFPKLCDPATTVAQAREFLRDDHVHALLMVDDGVLLTVLERDDLEPEVAGGAAEPARSRGRLRGRVVGGDADLHATWLDMIARGRRRLAVVDERGVLLGLLCLQRSRRGFCSDAGVAARAAERGE